jgi:hypothetical protein
VRKILVGLVVVAVVVLASAGAAGGDRSATRVYLSGRLSVRRVYLPGRLSVRVPAGWHVLRGWLSDVLDPVPRLAVASFPVRLSRHTCECGFPNVVNFPRNGAFVFVWEYLRFPRRQLARVPGGSAHFTLADGRGVRRTCDGPSDELSFKAAGLVFQVEVYLGPAITPALRSRVTTMLDSLRASPNSEAVPS